jgi:hypothetical protein
MDNGFRPVFQVFYVMSCHHKDNMRCDCHQLQGKAMGIEEMPSTRLCNQEKGFRKHFTIEQQCYIGADA